MSRIVKDQKGFTLVEGLLIIIAITLIVGVGFYVMNSNNTRKDKNSDSAIKTSKKAEKAKTVADPTADWTSYSSPLGKFSVKYPRAWVTASNPEDCLSTTETGIFMLGANSESVGKCATDLGGQISITWRTDRQFCGDLSGDAWEQTSKQNIKINGANATKIEAIAKETQGIGNPPGTKTVQYCIIANNATYIADYIQLAGYPDALNDFNTMTTKTLQFN